MGERSRFELGGSAPQRYERVVAPIMAPFVTALLDAVRIARGEAVLDVACGTGFAARAAAARVTPGGRVAAADLNPGMLAVAEAEAGDLPITWHQAPADRLPFADGEFDAVVCQQGLQFLPDLPAALTEAARVARDGARVAGTVWAPPQRSPYLAAQLRALSDLLGPPTGAAMAAAFASSPERFTSAFQAAGLRDVEAREVVAEVRLPAIRDYVPAHLAAIPWGIAAAEARPDGLELASAAILHDLGGAIHPDGSLTTPLISLLITATR